MFIFIIVTWFVLNQAFTVFYYVHPHNLVSYAEKKIYGLIHSSDWDLTLGEKLILYLTKFYQ